MISKEYYHKCVKNEQYKGIEKDNLSFIDKLWAHFFRPQTNAIIHLRKMQYWHGRFEILSKLHSVVLNRRYGMYINPEAQIEEGLYFPHPTGICMTNVRIGKDFTCLQNCTIGSKKLGMTKVPETPNIGNNVTMYANSMIIRKVHVADGVIIGSGSCLLKDADMAGGVYCGSPAHLVK